MFIDSQIKPGHGRYKKQFSFGVPLTSSNGFRKRMARSSENRFLSYSKYRNKKTSEIEGYRKHGFTLVIKSH